MEDNIVLPVEVEVKKIEDCRKWPIRSEEVNLLFSALAKAQAKMQVARRSSENPFFKSRYAGEEEVVEASRTALTDNGLSVFFPITPNEEGVNQIHCILAHGSGQFVVSRMLILPPKSDIQSFGSYVTYLKRYLYMALTGVATSFDDDDGEAAMTDVRMENYRKDVPTKYDAKNLGSEVISADQLRALEEELVGHDKITEDILKGYSINRLAYMKKSEFDKAIRRIRQIKRDLENTTRIG